MKAALNDLDDLVAVRQQYNLRVPKVSLTAVAVAMMSSDYLLNHKFDHPALHPENGPFFEDEEDIADGGSQVPLYMEEKQWIDDQIANHPEYAQYSYDSGHLTYDQWKANNEFWENHDLIMHGGGNYVIGHYTSMTNPYQDGVGMADANEYSSTDILADLNYKQVVDHVVNNPDGSKTTYYNLIPIGVKNDPNKGFTIDEYKNLVNKYVANPDAADFVATAQAAKNVAQSAVDSDQSELDAKNNSKDSIQKSIDNFNNAIVATQKAIQKTQDQLDSDNTELSKQQANLTQAQADLTALTASNAVKAANLNRAKAAQTQAETELANAKTALKNAQDNLDNAKSELANLEKTAQEKVDAAKKAQADLTKLQKRVSDLQNAPQILTNAKAATAKAQADYTAAKKAADDAEKALQKLASARNSADAQVASAQSAYEAAKAALDAAKDKLAKAQAELARIEDAEKRASSFTNGSSESANTKAMVLNHNARIYNSEGKQAKKPSLKKGETIKAWNLGKLVTIKGHKYYQIGKDEFVRAGNVSKVKKAVKKSTKKATTKTIRLNHNTFVYTKSGKAIRKGLHFKFVKRGKSIKALHNGKVVMIKGHEYYQIGKNEFVKVANGDVKTKAVNVRAEVKGSKKVRACDRSGKLNNHYLKAHHIYTFNEKKTINGKIYYKVKWTNNWVPANVLKFRK